MNIENSEAQRRAAEIGTLTRESRTVTNISTPQEWHGRLLAQFRQTEDAMLVDDLLGLAVKIRSRVGGVELSTDSLYDPETGLLS
ncbi:hypothetical protein [Sphaerimonospora thailandensis]|uniref:Uncharacterized protein n=1 Tax=Sphaerimonospora thailandensis TaxID=795644 RepID=A0A8J3VYG6_9ACTN|nr:hypothetical protein [Sphaerimonospora thailandensis]GIH70024.1 hypothetical protein Mth01_22770 [Sphaerimonospora thailandensis]